MEHDETRQRDQAFFASRGFGQRIGFGERPAVLVIDLARAFADPAIALGASLDDVIGQTNRVIDAAHAAKVPVLLSVVAYEGSEFEDAGVWRFKMTGLSALRAGSPGVEVDPRVRRLPGDPVIVKKFASFFFGTDLVSRLTAAHTDTVIVVGCTTSGCVRATVVDAMQFGFRPIVAREAVGDRSENAHQQSLFDMDAKYADVMGVDEVLHYLQRLRSGAGAGSGPTLG
jgi:nicotinamidase-related amidase